MSEVQVQDPEPAESTRGVIARPFHWRHHVRRDNPGNLHGRDISFAVKIHPANEDGVRVVQYAIAVCAPRDQFVKKTANRILDERMAKSMNDPHYKDRRHALSRRLWGICLWGLVAVKIEDAAVTYVGGQWSNALADLIASAARAMARSENPPARAEGGA